MGIETLLFISLAITFVMLIMLVYHFQNKFDSQEKRTSSLLEIINSVVKEIREVKTHITNQQGFCKNVCLETETMQIDLGNSRNEFNEPVITLNGEYEDNDDNDEDNDDDATDDDDDDNDDDATDDDDDDDDDANEDDDDDDQVNTDTQRIFQVENLDDKIVVSDTEEDIGEIIVHKLNNVSNYKKMDIRQLRQLAIERGLMNDNKKNAKKSELIEMLEKKDSV